ncbi:MAG: DMT family transporter [Chloroflexi bacterium]|nr:DMT family transporter [Chloroflexota bacterium]
MLIGEFAALSNAAIWALTGVITKAIGRDVRPVHIVTAHAWTGVTIFLIAGLATGQIDDLLATGARPTLILAGGALINTAGAFVFWMAITRGSVSRVYPTTQSVFILTTVLTSWVVLGESPGVGVAVGAPLIIGGVVFLNWHTKSEEGASISDGGLTVPLLAVLTSLLWAGAFVTAAEALKDAEPLAGATIRNIVPAVLYLMVAIFVPSSRLSRVPRVAYPRILLSGVLFAYGAFSFVFALDRAPAGVVAVLINTSPMWALGLSFIFLGERLNRFRMFGVVLSIAGIVAVLALG